MKNLEQTFNSAGFKLSGTLTIPGEEGPFPGVLLIAGSGRVDRDENIRGLPLNVLAELAAHLATAGYASFRFDKRGVGKSEGDFLTTGFFDNVEDAAAALEVLRASPHVDNKRIFVIGHSEGAIIATKLAAKTSGLAGVVLLSCPVQTGEDVLLWQSKRVSEGLTGLSKWIVRLFRIDLAKKQRKQLDRIKASTEYVLQLGLFTKLNAKWFREYMAYDPEESLRGLATPVLAITGTKDVQVNPDDLERMGRLDMKNFEAHRIEDVNHILRCEPESPSIQHYRKQTREPIDPRIPQLIVSWFGARI